MRKKILAIPERVAFWMMVAGILVSITGPGVLKHADLLSDGWAATLFLGGLVVTIVFGWERFGYPPREVYGKH